VAQSTKKRRFEGLFADLLIIAGIGLIGYGLYLWRIEVALVVVGAIVLILGLVMIANSDAESVKRDI
jgi:uncharacterized membrane protein